jgi:hypothetical protein
VKRALLLAAVACKAKAARDDAAVAPPVPADAATWRELDDYPIVTAVRTIPIPLHPNIPREHVAGPVIAGDVAVVASSQFGFVAIDWRAGKLAWTRAGDPLAPPAVADGVVVLIAACPQSPIGCARVVTATGSDQAYVPIRGSFAGSGDAQLWPAGDHAVRWRRGDTAVTVDLLTGATTPADAAPPPVVVEHHGKRWDIRQVDGKIVATGTQPWSTEHRYTALVGAVRLPDQGPMVRIANASKFRGVPEIHLHDIDATGSLHGAVARPLPGIAVLAWGVSAVGDAALAVRIDPSQRRDVVAGYAANAMLMWTWPLPEAVHAAPIGVAIAPDAVVVFHDGSTLTVLPELSAPSTAPGAPPTSSNIPTP